MSLRATEYVPTDARLLKQLPKRVVNVNWGGLRSGLFLGEDE
jgi:hypothetical protein